MPTRRSTLAMLMAATSQPAFAQNADTRVIKLVVPFAAGGSTDLVARILAEAVSNRLKQPMIVENRPGAGVILGTSAVSKADPDGTTFLFTTVAHAINPTLQARLPYDSLADFEPVARVATVPLVLSVNPNVPVATLPEFLAYVQANPGKLNYGSAGVGSALHMAAEVLKYQAKLDIIHVPYRGAGPAMNDLLANQVQFIIDPVSTSAPQITANKIRALAVTSQTRSPSIPHVPTFAEAGLPDYDASTWNIVLAPKGTTPATVNRLNHAINQAMAEHVLVSRLQQMHVVAISDSTPTSSRAFLQRETERWAIIIKSAGLKVEN